MLKKLLKIVVIVLGVIVALGPYIVIMLFSWVDWLLTGWTMRSRVTFDKKVLREGSDGLLPTRLVVMPALMSRTDSVMGRLAPLLQRCLPDTKGGYELFVVDSVGTRFKYKQVVKETFEMLKKESDEYDKMIFVGQSMGGMFASLDIEKFYFADGHWHARLAAIMADVPSSWKDFGLGGDIASQLMKPLLFSRGFNLFPGRLLMEKMKAMPERRNIGDEADFATLTGDPSINSWDAYCNWVDARALKQLSGHQLSVWRDQMVAMARIKMPWDIFRRIPVVYLACTGEGDKKTLRAMFGIGSWIFTQPIDKADPLPRNITVKQPQAASVWHMRGNAHVHVVRATHVGYDERPGAFERAFNKALRQLQ